MSLFSKNKQHYEDKKSLIIYFSRAGENYSVGNIAKGNTEVIAEYIKDLTNADMFKVEGKNLTQQTIKYVLKNLLKNKEKMQGLNL